MHKQRGDVILTARHVSKSQENIVYNIFIEYSGSCLN